MTLYLKVNPKYNRSKLKLQLLLSKYRHFQLWLVVFLIPLKVQGHMMPHLKALRYGIYEARLPSCGSTSSICQAILKSVNLTHKQGYVKTQLICIVPGWNFGDFQQVQKVTYFHLENLLALGINFFESQLFMNYMHNMNIKWRLKTY